MSSLARRLVISRKHYGINPTLPANNSLVSSAELRNQFNGLNELIIGLQDQCDDTPHNTNGIAQLSLTILDASGKTTVRLRPQGRARRGQA